MEGLLQIAYPAGQCLPGKAVDQVDSQVVETGRTGLVNHGASFGTVVDTPQKMKRIVPERLHADIQTIHTDLPQVRQALATNSAGIGFQGNFDVGQKIEMGPHGGQHISDC